MKNYNQRTNQLSRRVLGRGAGMANQRVPAGIHIGNTPNGPITLSLEEITRTGAHAYVFGATRSGKTKWCENLMRQIVARRLGHFLYMDPAGDTAKDILRYCLVHGKRISTVYLKPGDPQYVVGINPLHIPDEIRDSGDIAALQQYAYRAATVTLNMFGSVNDEEMQETKIIKRWLRNALQALALGGYNLAHLPLLLGSSEFRRELISQTPDLFLALEWQLFDAAPAKERFLMEVPLYNRIIDFTLNPAFRAMFTETENVLHPIEAMQQGINVIVDLSEIEELDRAVLAKVLVNLFKEQAKKRPDHSRYPYLLILDEFHEYLSSDIANVLSALGKFGVGAVLAHQIVDQIALKYPEVFSAVLGNCQHFICFRGSDTDAERLVRTIFPGYLVEGKPIPGTELYRLSHKIRESRRESKTVGQSDTVGQSQAVTESESVAKSRLETISESETNAITLSRSISDTISEGEADSSSTSQMAGTNAATIIGSVDGSSHSMGFGVANGDHRIMRNNGQTHLDSVGAVAGSNIAIGQSDSHSSTRGNSYSLSEGEAETRALTKGKAITKGETVTRSSAATNTNSLSHTDSRSVSEQVYDEKIPFQELASRQYYTIQGLFEMLRAAIQHCAPRHFFYRHVNSTSTLLAETPFVHPVRMARYREHRRYQELMESTAVNVGHVQHKLVAKYSAYMALPAGYSLPTKLMLQQAPQSAAAKDQQPLSAQPAGQAQNAHSKQEDICYDDFAE